jgi:hypothetical protein
MSEPEKPEVELNDLDKLLLQTIGKVLESIMTISVIIANKLGGRLKLDMESEIHKASYEVVSKNSSGIILAKGNKLH